jgi:hypothetical protein
MLTAIAIAAMLPGAQDWTPIFDGKTLDGWTQKGGTAKYEVVDGVILGTAVPNTPNSFLCTEKMYADFDLTLEYKVHPKLNSGIQIRSNSFSGYNNGRVHGYQVEIDPSDRSWSAGIYEEGRRGWLNSLEFNEPARKAFKQGEWNRYRIIAKGDHIRTWINGVPAANLRDGLTRKGFIGLQVHGIGGANPDPPYTVMWRNIKIKDLGDPWSTPPEGATVLLSDDGDLSGWKKARSDEPIEWEWIDGAMQVKPGTGSIESKAVFGSGHYHIEFSVDDNGAAGQGNGNSGVYTMGRYEVQILNSAPRKPAHNECGGIYSVKAPDYALAMAPGEWQTYDILFTEPEWEGGKKIKHARMTVYHNGTKIHDDVEVPHETTAGLSPESERLAGISLQDHGNKIRFRNVWVKPA